MPMGGGGDYGSGQIPDGMYTEMIYGMIQEGKYADVISRLSYELQSFPRSRAALSLLGYSYYMQQDYPNAVRMYEQLSKLFPEVQEYKIYFAQSLHKAGMFPEATRAAYQVDDPQFTQRTNMLQAAIKYEQDDLRGCIALADECLPDDPDTIVCNGCVDFKEGRYEDAKAKFTEAMNALGYQADLSHNIALCHYKLNQNEAALRIISEIIERGVTEHPELSVGSHTDGVEVRSVGNSQVLRETALVEAFNLKAAIEFDSNTPAGLEAAREALKDMPPRMEEELDPVTLHNQALMTIEQDFTGGFRKLNFLLLNPPFPPTTFANLLLLYCKYQYYDLAADVLAEHTHLTFRMLAPELYEYLDSTIMVQASPEEAYRKYDDLAKKNIETLRKLTKQIQDARIARENDSIRAALAEYDNALQRYIPVIMAMARIYWDRENYPQVEKIFRASADFCLEHDTWKLNVAHVFFIQEGKYKEAIHYYELIVQKAEHVLDVTAIVLANLCVSYIMTSQNEKAEDLMRRIEKEEEKIGFEDPDKQCFHLCIVNLVIGTLYCAKNNFEFGISRIMKSLEPYEKKLGTDTWFYAKRCFLSLAETLSKHMLMLPDATFHDILSFFAAADQHGRSIPTLISSGPDTIVDPERHNVSYEARQLRRVYLKLRE